MGALSHKEVGEVLSFYLDHDVPLTVLAEDEGIALEDLERMIRHWEPSSSIAVCDRALRGAVKAVLKGQGVVAASKAWCVGVVVLRRELAKHPTWVAKAKPSSVRAPKGGGFRGELEAWIRASSRPVTIDEILSAFPAKPLKEPNQHRREMHNALGALCEQGRVRRVGSGAYSAGEAK